MKKVLAIIFAIVALVTAYLILCSPVGQRAVDRVLDQQDVMYAQQRALWQGGSKQ